VTRLPSPEGGPARALLARYYRAMLDKNADDLAALYAPATVHEFPLLSPFFPQRLKGREEIRAHYGAVWRASPMRLTEVREVAFHETHDPRVVIAEAEYSAVSTSTEKSFDLSFLLVMRIEEELIVHLRDYMDALGAAFALDRLPMLVESLSRRTGSR
jgi:ketosteroid isomerase-like protein